jgi:hypothetical protein
MPAEAARADRVVSRVQAVPGDVLVFSSPCAPTIEASEKIAETGPAAAAAKMNLRLRTPSGPR